MSYSNLEDRGWRFIQRKQIRMTVERNVAESIVEEWKGMDHDGSIWIKSLVNRIERLLKSPKYKGMPRGGPGYD